MRYAHAVAQVRAAEAELMARLPAGALMQRAATGLAVACAQRLGRVYASRVVLLVVRVAQVARRPAARTAKRTAVRVARRPASWSAGSATSSPRSPTWAPSSGRRSCG